MNYMNENIAVQQSLANDLNNIVNHIHLKESRHPDMLVGYDERSCVLLFEKADGQRYVHCGIPKYEYEMCLA